MQLEFIRGTTVEDSEEKSQWVWGPRLGTSIILFQVCDDRRVLFFSAVKGQG